MSGEPADVEVLRRQAAEAYVAARQLLVEAMASHDHDALVVALDAADRAIDHPGHDLLPSGRRAAAHGLAAAGRQRIYDLTGDVTVLDESLRSLAIACDLADDDDPNRLGYFSNAATLYSSRYESQGDPTDLDRAIGLFEAVEAEARASGNVQIWAHNYGQSLLQRAQAEGSDDVVAHLDRAVELLTSATRVPPNEADAETGAYATTLAQALRQRSVVTGSVLDLVEASQEARRAVRLTAGSTDEANAHSVLGNTLLDQLERTGQADEGHAAMSPRSIADEAVEAHRAALHLDGGSTLWPKLAANLANGLAVRYDRFANADDLDESIHLLKGAVDDGGLGLSERRMILDNLGAVELRSYERSGDLAMLDRAISRFEAALAIGSTHELRQNLAVALMARYRRLVRPDVLDTAIDALEKALDEADDPMAIAASSSSLGNGLFLRYGNTGCGEDLDAAIAAHRVAVGVAEGGSHDQAMFRGNLALSLAERARLDGDLMAIRACVSQHRAALAQCSRDAPEIGRLYAGLAETLAALADMTGRDDDAGRARRAFELAATEVAELDPEQVIGTAVAHGDWELRRSHWEQARSAYGAGERSARLLFDTHRTAVHRESWLRAVDGLPQTLAYACARDDAPVPAVMALENGRALLLSEALGRRQVEPSEQPLPAVGRTPVVWLVATEVGGLAIVAAPHVGGGNEEPDLTPVWLDRLEPLTVATQLERLRQAYALRRDDRGAWRTAVSSCVAWLDDAFAPLDGVLGQGDVMIVPTGLLAQLPLQLSRPFSPLRPSNDAHAAAFVPSLTTAGDPGLLPGLRSGATVAVANPASTGLPPLRFSVDELGPFGHGPPPLVLSGPDATRTRVLEEMAKASVLHVAVHGRAVPEDPRRSSIVLAGGEELSVDDLLSEGVLEGTMVVLATCESAVPGVDLPDELIGLPAAFLQAGGLAVIGAQWAIAHDATVVLMNKFYADWRAGVPPHRALHRAQSWLAQLTNGEIVDSRLRSRLPDGLPERALAAWRGGRPYPHPASWGALVYYGPLEHGDVAVPS